MIKKTLKIVISCMIAIPIVYFLLRLQYPNEPVNLIALFVIEGIICIVMIASAILDHKHKIVDRVRNYNGFFYIHFHKHYCPHCGKRLRPIKVSKIIKCDSAEAQDFANISTAGCKDENLKLIQYELKCPKCKQAFLTNEIRQIEKLASNE